MVEDSTEIGAVAVDFLVAMMHRGGAWYSRSAAANPRRRAVNGREVAWPVGRTLGRIVAPGGRSALEDQRMLLTCVSSSWVEPTRTAPMTPLDDDPGSYCPNPNPA